ncbi:MAG: DUF3786 domain-containing protein [Candidatus Hodarchaeales archaeon]|jgi:hypothetical protein
MNTNKSTIENPSKALYFGWELLIRRNPEEVAEYGQVEYDKSNRCFHVEMFKERYIVDLRSRKVSRQPSTHYGKPVSVSPLVATLVIHYLVHVKNIEVTNDLMTFRQLPRGGNVYYPAFNNRAIEPIVKRFGNNPDDLHHASLRIGGTPLKEGDASIKVSVFPKIPVTVIIWKGEESIPPSANILFDRTAKDQLPVEDLAVIGGLIANRLA